MIDFKHANAGWDDDFIDDFEYCLLFVEMLPKKYAENFQIKFRRYTITFLSYIYEIT